MVLPSASNVAIGSRNAHPSLPSAPALHSYTCAPSACTDSTIVSPAAAMASGSVSAARALTSEPDSRSRARAAFVISGISLGRRRFGQVFRDLVEEAGGGQPALVGANQKR